ncbi:MAG TPA: UdgX family uracil-DNA binding protein [Casimicrobiaceae bacterium]|nr:UdgX family uracil-DNA binding protein [Casimicrobiaceae bacterium]
MHPSLQHIASGSPREEGGPATCRRCILWREASQAVVGEGRRGAPLMLVGEAPGSEDDRIGRPFVGPSGVLLSELLREARIDPTNVFMTNAVKHFGYRLRGRRRMPRTPGQREIEACNMWLRREIEDIAPKVIVTLGTTGLKAILGQRLAIVAARERALAAPEGIPVVATYHPLALLRAPAQAEKNALRRAVLADLRRALQIAGC